jgi:hypothetical protein
MIAEHLGGHFGDLDYGLGLLGSGRRHGRRKRHFL